jgi:phospholipid/cholesterol/gamma-HCH transport system permease protein
MRLLKGFWSSYVSWFSDAGRAAMLTWSVFVALFKKPYELKPFSNQLYHIGVKALPVVLITGIVVGFVSAIQAFYQLKAMSAQGMIGGFVVTSIIKELAPMLTAFVTAARVGTGMSAELGTMKVTEQIDALRAMATDPVKYLVVPRLISCAIMLPILIVFSDIAGILGGYFMSVYLGMTGSFFIEEALKFLFVRDIIAGLIKGMTFGVIIALVGCHKGLDALGGAEGVGRATASSAVNSFILIIIADFFLNYGIYAVLGI